MPCIIDTKFGRASINQRGYYDIVSQKEGNFRKKLHRLIYEDFYKVCLMSWADIHHKDGNKLNNSIDNLELISHDNHTKLHHTGKQIKHSLERNMTHSKTTSTTGYFRVTKRKEPRMIQGYMWAYQYYDENHVRKRIARKTLEELEEVVKSKGLVWRKL